MEPARGGAAVAIAVAFVAGSGPVAARSVAPGDPRGSRETSEPAAIVSDWEATLVPPDGASGDFFGVSVDVSSDGSVAIVGAYADVVSGIIGGSARIFVRAGTTWTEEATLTNGAPAAADSFGYAVAISDDAAIAIVGAPFDDTTAGTDSGSATIFTRSGSTWAPTPLTNGTALTGGSRMGWSVALSGDGRTALVGAPRERSLGLNENGTVRVYVRDAVAWRWAQTYAPWSAGAGSWWGYSVAVDRTGARMIIGAPSYDDSAIGPDSGRAAVLTWDGFAVAEEAQILWPVVGGSTWLGASVAIDGAGNVVAVGSPAVMGNTGTVRIHARAGTSWSYVTSLVSPDAAAGETFGASVALDDAGDSLAVGVPYEMPGVNLGSVRVFGRAGTNWAGPTDVWLPSGDASDNFGTSVALSADGSRLIGGALRADPTGVATGAAGVFLLRDTLGGGVACPEDRLCTSGHCVDGVCCDTTCGEACAACSVAAGGVADGTCGPLEATTAAATVCRTAAATCDAVEVCSPASVDCPGDGRLPVSTPCRPAAGDCDVAELCDGTSIACPGDAIAGGAVVCRPSAGPCDPNELCNGTSAACPTDLRHPAGFVCAPSAGTTCDLDDLCDGTQAICSPRFAAATVLCDATSAGVCDAPDHCAGSSADCVATFLSGTECRASSGSCDPAEACTGGSATCPPDAVHPAGTTCRASSAACDPAESCDGVATSCPTDVACAADAGGSDASSSDAGAPAGTSGCGCRVGSAPLPSTALAAWLAVALVAPRRRRPSPSRGRC